MAQRIMVDINIENDSPKLIRLIRMSLIKTLNGLGEHRIEVYHPRSELIRERSELIREPESQGELITLDDIRAS